MAEPTQTRLIENALYSIAYNYEGKQASELLNAIQYHAPYVRYGLALRWGLITEQEYQSARKQWADLWNYVGD